MRRFVSLIFRENPGLAPVLIASLELTDECARLCLAYMRQYLPEHFDVFCQLAHSGVLAFRTAAVYARYVKIWCDRSPLTGEVKGSSITVVSGEFKIVVTSNFSIADVFANEKDRNAIKRRFTEVELTMENRVLIMACKIEDLADSAGIPNVPAEDDQESSE
jgi:hypothetical protein